ncbi:hypothetical protein ACFVIM_21350 [Streptomyces sp. NPDC057638]|uniref:hypothetical protein n=1 Tax=Streptomyces sp. NPDC057638 TaxID=3346190 RepID=UPI0036830B55
MIAVPVPRRGRGRVEDAVGRTVRALRPAGADPARAALEALARELGRGVDTAGARSDVFALAQITPRLLDVLDRLTPRETEGGAVADLLAGLADPD